MLPKKVSINNIHVFLGTQCRKFRAKKFPVFSNFSIRFQNSIKLV